jgi:tetratricopeptide (TPR) repeat protein
MAHALRPGSSSLAASLLFLSAAILSACGGETAEDQEGRVEEAPVPALSAEDLPEGAQAWSLLGEPLYPPAFSEEARAALEAQLDEAVAELRAAPEDPDAMIWAGRRYAYLGEYRRAIDLFTAGVSTLPEDPRFLRHRGHRYISVREFDNAIADFSRASEMIQGTEDEVEPDGMPNALGIPTSTLHFNIWYHYGLAHYLKGEFDQALEKYRECMEVSDHPDSKVATAHWLYMSLRRLGMGPEAEDFIHGLDLDALAPEVIESGSYLELLRLYQGSGEGEMGVESPQDMSGAALMYGYGNWLFYNGRQEEARAVFQDIVGARDQWASFGYIAAEAELARQ